MLLAIILFLFLIYANSFLVKRRQKEFGLYHILGLEKKHIGSMMFFETVLTYMITLAGGIVLGLVLAKLLFLILLRMSGMRADVEFVFSPKAFEQTLSFFFWVFAVNFARDLWYVGKARPVELMSGSKKGEKEPRFLLFYALVGVLTLGIGYRISIRSELNSAIFTDFFLAVFLVIIGTYLLFTSGSIVLLKMLKKRKKIYYKPKNFITISGMLYRMKKSAASLSNLCIFSTMVIITLVCTVSLYLGMDNILQFGFPYDLTVHYREDKVSREEVLKELELLKDKYGNSVNRMDIYEELGLSSHKEGSRFVLQEGRRDYQEDFNVKFLTLDDYNQIA
ncbi:MAG: FtsX-like permease family protein, partial [Lachnospiraceae bacterium]|nr:FtsX-like permease family protein [Lachnospiraceae bacterium]